MRRLIALAAAVMALSGCASVAREPDDLALVRVLGVDGAGPVVLTAVCGGDDQKDVNRGAVSASDFGTARREIPWSGTGEELALSGVSYLLVGPDVDMAGLLLAVLEDEELGATATVWLVEEGAGMVLEACGDPAADLELLERLLSDGRLSPQETARLSASREQFGSYWVLLERRLRQGKLEADLLPFLRQLASAAGGSESFLRAALALRVFDERGLLSMTLCGGRMTLCLNQIQGKVDLFSCPYLLRLRNSAGN